MHVTKKKLELGRIVATPAALDVLDASNQTFLDLLRRHQNGDYGGICEEDKKLNEQGLITGSRILSAYKTTPNEKEVWVISEADRSATTILLPREY